jgi:hypothetical protein
MARAADRLSRRQERRLLRAGRSVFAEQFPNPERIGCPSPDVLRAMASRRPTSDGNPYPVEHLTMCSPCFREYSSYRRRVQMMNGARFALIAATMVLAIGAALWLLLGRFGFPSTGRHQEIAQITSLPPFRPVTLDLRPLSLPRGEGRPQTGQPTLTIPRDRVRITFLLPVGSDDGPYEVQVLAGGRRPILLLRGQARILDSVATLRTEADLRALTPGSYEIRVGRPGFSSQVYSVVLE